jgi:rubrerythrin
MSRRKQKVRRSDAETLARQVNDEPWDPPPGMVKVVCSECEYLFASDLRTPLCPECRKPHIRHRGPRL